RYWDRIERPEQIVTSLPDAMRVLTSPADTGAVTLALPQDVQAEAYDYPAALFEPRIWKIPRARADRDRLREAAAMIRTSRRPLIVAGGGVIYSEASDALRGLVDATGIPVGETQAGKGALPEPHPLAAGGIGATGTLAANLLARDADLVIVVGSRLSDFTTASKTAFQHEHVRFIAINVAELDAHKHAAVPLVGDARAALEELGELVAGYHVETEYTERIAFLIAAWQAEAELVCGACRDLSRAGGLVQTEVIGVLQQALTPNDTIVCAAGSLPGDLHKLWRARDPKAYHLEYGYSCMGYEIAGGIGVKMAAPERGVYVLVGDGSYLMMAQEIATAVQERIPITIVVFDNQGFASIGGLSASLGSGGFGTRYRYRSHATGELDGDLVSVDFAANAASLGARACRVESLAALRAALTAPAPDDGPVVIVVPVDRDARLGGYQSWWDVPVAEVSTMAEVQRARTAFETARRRER